jgi:[ribosomal protein S5]-alanine N-acetyltransferase
MLVDAEITLRPYREDDIPALAALANNPRVAENLRDVFPHPYGLSDAEHFVRTMASAPGLHNFAVEVRGVFAGGAGIAILGDVYRRTAEIGYWLGEPFWGRGIGTRVVRMIAEHAFSLGPICRLEAAVFENNRASQRVLEKAGFALEARHRLSVTKNGVTMDSLMYARVLPDRV